jgi:hypothetical protein
VDAHFGIQENDLSRHTRTFFMVAAFAAAVHVAGVQAADGDDDSAKESVVTEGDPPPYLDPALEGVVDPAFVASEPSPSPNPTP